MILDEAKQAVQDRMKEYGPPAVNLEDIARAWSNYFRQDLTITPTDVCLLMILLKVERQKGGEYHRDTIMDIIGYAYIIALLNGEDPDA